MNKQKIILSDRVLKFPFQYINNKNPLFQNQYVEKIITDTDIHINLSMNVIQIC